MSAIRRHTGGYARSGPSAGMRRAAAHRRRGGARSCARQLVVKADEPHLITPRVDPGVPVLRRPLRGGAPRGHRRGQGARPRRPHRAARRRPAAGLERCWSGVWVGTPLPLCLHRPGDLPLGAAAATPSPEWRARPPPVCLAMRRDARLRMRAMVRDSVGLSSAARQRNIAGRVKRPVAGQRRRARGRRHRHHRRHRAESVRSLHIPGARVVGVLAVANASDDGRRLPRDQTDVKN